MTIVDVIPLSLGESISNGVYVPVIPRSSTIPCKITKTFVTSINNQYVMGFDVSIFLFVCIFPNSLSICRFSKANAKLRQRTTSLDRFLLLVWPREWLDPYIQIWHLKSTKMGSYMLVHRTRYSENTIRNCSLSFSISTIFGYQTFKRKR